MGPIASLATTKTTQAGTRRSMTHSRRTFRTVTTIPDASVRGHDDAVLAGTLCLVEAPIGVVQQVAQGSEIGERRDPEARGRAHRRVADRNRHLPELALDPLGNALRTFSVGVR